VSRTSKEGGAKQLRGLTENRRSAKKGGKLGVLSRTLGLLEVLGAAKG